MRETSLGIEVGRIVRDTSFVIVVGKMRDTSYVIVMGRNEEYLTRGRSGKM